MQKFMAISWPILFVLLFATNLSAQQWSDAQKDVWAGVEKYWEAGMAADPTDFLSFFDDTYTGWSYQSETPGTKKSLTKVMTYWMKKGQTKLYVITPSKIWVNGDFAYVHYYYYMVNESSEGKPMPESGRWTDILMKKDGRWMLVGDHGGEIEEDD
jgi:ketosteroid isomerase-like protein